MSSWSTVESACSDCEALGQAQAGRSHFLGNSQHIAAASEGRALGVALKCQLPIVGISKLIEEETKGPR
jgi:hypothetical protein